ncbi:MAG TPA: hypothetical protein VFD92_19600 [Candidatus Binatia bacterium]|nr:hypothetical protein [Candidatus Binatia bacterium]
MRNRLHLGATYYFFWALPALVAPGPGGAYAFAAVLGVVAVAATGALATATGGVAAGLAAMAWLATSPTAVIDSRIAWAPAAIPAWCAALLLVARSLLARATRAKASLLAALATFGTQLHLSAGALAPVAAGAILARVRTIGAGGVAAAAVAAALPLVPMALAWRVPLPAPSNAAVASASSPFEHRLADLVALGARWLDGLSPTGAARPAPVDAWLQVEVWAGLIPVAAAIVAWLARARSRHPAGVGLVVAAFAAAVVVPAVLPAEVWGYYLDGALVPGAVLVGIAATRPRWRRVGAAALALLCAGRVALLAWWIATAASQGWVATQLELLRVGGARPSHPAARARLLGWGVKQEAARILSGDLAIPRGRLWRDVHGPGFADLDTDNGYFLGAPSAGRAAAADPGRSAAVLHRGELDPEWLAAFAPAARAGPLDVYGYEPVLGNADLRLANCGGAPAPARRPPDPLDYGAGEPPLPDWPCATPVVEVPFAAPPAGVALRVFPRVIGRGRVVAVESEPAGTAVRAAAPGLDRGLLLPAQAGRLRVHLEIAGPAALDLVELHGRAW